MAFTTPLLQRLEPPDDRAHPPRGLLHAICGVIDLRLDQKVGEDVVEGYVEEGRKVGDPQVETLNLTHVPKLAREGGKLLASRGEVLAGVAQPRVLDGAREEPAAKD